MGLSASQARLLSITSRLTNNEYESQQLTNAKLRLATASQAARTDYINALDTSKLTYLSYDSHGDAVKEDLTHSLLYQYKPLKNQYALINSSNQILVSHVDAENFENTDNIADFLMAYDLLQKVKNPDYEYDYNKYLENLQDYNDAMAVYEVEYPEYLAQMEEYNKEYAEWIKNKGSNKAYDAFRKMVGDFDHPKSCYSNAIGGAVGCYLHLLAYMVDFNGAGSGGNYTTTTGKSVHIGDNERSGSAISWDIGRGNLNEQDFKDFSALMCRETDPFYCDKDDDYHGDGDKDKLNSIQKILNSGGTPTEGQLLMSDYKIVDGETVLKTLKEKAIDLAYLCKKSGSLSSLGITRTDLQNTIYNFTDGDLKSLNPQPERPEKPEKPEKPLPPDPADEYFLQVKDKDKAQWYANLWERMNGTDTPTKIHPENVENFITEEVIVPDVVHFKGDKFNKDPLKARYKEIDGNLATNTDWLKDSVKTGIVSLVRIELTEEKNTTEFNWSSMAYSSAAEFVEVDDDAKIARAEAEYERTMQVINAKDERFSLRIKALDSEHNALQTQYQSIQSELNKNVERSYTVFKG